MQKRTPEVQAAITGQYQRAVSMVNRYSYASYADDYYFGSTSGMGVLAEAHSASETPTILDVGAGMGLFLRHAQDHLPEGVRTVGIAAVAHPMQCNSATEWVYGDVQRPETWQEPDTIEPGTVDIGVSSLTFTHLADPLGALEHAMHLLKPGGQLFVDKLRIHLDPANCTSSAEALREDLRTIEGELGLRFSFERRGGSSPYAVETANITEAHFRRTEDFHLDSLAPAVYGPMNDRVRYELAE